MHNRNPANLEWMEDIRALRGVTEVSLWVADANSCAELMLDRLIEVRAPLALKLKISKTCTVMCQVFVMRLENIFSKSSP